MRIAILTTDNREQLKDYSAEYPYFGTAPEALIQGFSTLPNTDVHVVSCSKKQMRNPERLADNICFHQPLVPMLGWGRTLFLGCAKAVRHTLSTIRPDIVHGQGTERDCAVSAVLSGFPNVLTIHGNMRVHAQRPEQKGSIYYKMAAALEWLCLRRTNGVVAISRYTQDLVKNLAPRTWLLPNAVDLRFFDVHPVPPSVPRVLFVGALNERKNPLGLLEACAPLLRKGQCTVALAGQLQHETRYGAQIAELAASLPGVQFLGFLSREALAREFSKSSILVLPTFEDNCPMVVLEAMASGLPVAASAVGGIPDLIKDRCDGVLFNPHNGEDLRRSIALLLSDCDLRTNVAKTAKRKAQQLFHPEKIARKHLEIYKEILGAQAGSQTYANRNGRLP